jgi:hypothetical protein
MNDDFVELTCDQLELVTGGTTLPEVSIVVPDPAKTHVANASEVLSSLNVPPGTVTPLAAIGIGNVS